ncbi:hypothetical protein [Mycobacteroides abscessus]|uniref:hypothetical protein n=1 Tax=Mycobacteroides abscessus TaxID=36809 RepID=UPI0005E9CDE5|nr:hypothetical protein [Mycobacteroides abscessus]CPW53158.1 Uncharacterised protein [Mycobacteroides abscessus]SKF43544.1 Uncharacterised protein [Mycobacteroides abscessus subsp. bolletii]SKH17137.1 Uncharacterised protein [Mycobacteroides abscessus subsp. bolletii]
MWTTIFIAILFLIAIGAFVAAIKSGRQAKLARKVGDERRYEDKAENSFWSGCASFGFGVLPSLFWCFPASRW